METAGLVGRCDAFDVLRRSLLEKERGKRHVFVDGRRKSGKSSLLTAFKDFVQERPVLFINLEHIVSSPALFARNFLGQVIGQSRRLEVPYSAGLRELERLLVTHEFSPAHHADPGHFGSGCGHVGPRSGEVAGAASVDGDDALSRACRPLMGLLDSQRPGHEKLVREVFSLPARIADELDSRIVVLYDNFENIFNLQSYPELKRIEKLVGEVLAAHDRVSYAVSGTRSFVLGRLFRRSGFWNRKFRRLPLDPLSREDTYYLASSIFGAERRPVPREVLPTIHYYSQGIPFYVRAICDRTLTLAKRRERRVDQDTVNEAFVLELLKDDGLINSVCHSMYFDGLASVSGENSLRAVLQVLAAEEGLKLAEIARRIGRPNGQAHGYLKALIEADLLFVSDRRFYYKDPLLRFFISQNMFNNFHNLEGDGKRIRMLARRFFEEFIVKRPDMGFGLEFRVRLLASFFDGRRMDGACFGSPEPVILPDGREGGVLVDMDKDGLVNGRPGLVVSDLCLDGRRRWMVEIFRGDDLVEKADLDLALRKRRFFERRTRTVFDRLWLISEVGFTEECREEAEAGRILISVVDEDLPLLEERLVEGARAA